MLRRVWRQIAVRSGQNYPAPVVSVSRHFTCDCCGRQENIYKDYTPTEASQRRVSDLLNASEKTRVGVYPKHTAIKLSSFDS